MRALLAGTALLVLVAANPSGQPREDGAITGRVTLTSRVRGTPLASNAYQPRAVGRHAPGGTPEISNVVVYLKGLAFKGTLPPARHAIEQRNETFVPRVLAVTRGAVVAFPNADPYFHNVFSLSGAASFDLGRYPSGRSKEWRFPRAGLVKVFCHIHSHMSASILVLDHPHFTVPELDGTFTLSGVPPGRYTLVGWHERVGERTGIVDVQPGRTSSFDLSLPVEDDQ